VNPRNGRKDELEVAGGGLERFELPPHRPPWTREALAAWDGLRNDPVWRLFTTADRPILLRWVDAIDRAGRAFRRADRNPVVIGGNAQVTEHPSYTTAAKAIAIAERCEQQMGVGSLNKFRLGLTVNQAKKSLLELNEAFAGGAQDDDDDPRLG